jgi:bacteriocin biosynthesis cyclodehydratase domain-containing protein
MPSGIGPASLLVAVESPKQAAAQLAVLSFKQHLAPVVVPGEGVFLFSDQGVTTLHGGNVEALTQLLDGSRTIPEVLDAATSHMPLAHAQQALTELAEAGLVDVRTPAASHESAFWDRAGLNNENAANLLRTSTVELVAIGRVDLAPVRRACLDAGLRVADENEQAETAAPVDLCIVICDDYLNPELAIQGTRNRARSIPWLVTKPAGPQVWVGPFMRADDGACWSCLSYLLWGNRRAEALVQASLGMAGQPALRSRTSLPALTAVGANMVALEAVKWLAGHRAQNQHQIWTLCGLDLSSSTHEVRRRPECAYCGDPNLISERGWQPVRLQSRPVTDITGGGYRALSAEQVMKRFGHLVDPVTGVVSRIRRDDRGPAFFNSYRADGNAAAGASELAALRGGLRCENGGKGVTPLLGEVSALCESLERHSGHFRGDEARLRASSSALGGRAIDPASCQLFDPRQYQERRPWNTAHAPFQRVCEPFDNDAERDWSPVWSMTHQEHRLLPTAMLYYGVRGDGAVRADSNGCAAGASLEDAVLQGALELIERDAVSLWWYNRTSQPAVSLEAFGDDWTAQVVAGYAELNRQIWVLDVTADLAVPTMVAVSRRTDKPAEDIIFGFGAHLDPRVALRRALTEINQMMPSLVEVGDRLDEEITGENEYRCGDPDAVSWWRTATIENQPYLLPDPDEPARTPADYEVVVSADLLQDVQLVQRRIEACGLEMLVLDQTRADIGLPVVKVLVPGLRSLWARFAPGRLFDVPVMLGRRAVPIAYEDLNPIPMFL